MLVEGPAEPCFRSKNWVFLDILSPGPFTGRPEFLAPFAVLQVPQIPAVGKTLKESTEPQATWARAEVEV